MFVSENRAFIYEQSWGWWLLQVGTPLILLVGMPGNILSIIVVNSRRFQGKSYIHYLSSIAVFDSLVLIMKYLRRVDSLIEATGQDAIFSQYGDVACKIHNFGEHVCFLMSSWLVLCMTLERFIAVVFPFQRDTFCKPRSAVIIIIIVFAILSYSQIFRLVIVEKGEYSCTAPEKYLHIYVAMHIYMYQLVMQFLLPAMLIMIFNVTILYKIRMLRRQVTQHGTVHNYTQFQKGAKTTCMLLIVSFTYVVTVLPLVILSMTIHVAMKVDPTAARFMIFSLNDLRFVLEFISEINYGANFYIYIMSGTQFRYQLRYIISHRHSYKKSSAKERVFQFRNT